MRTIKSNTCCSNLTLTAQLPNSLEHNSAAADDEINHNNNKSSGSSHSVPSLISDSTSSWDAIDVLKISCVPPPVDVFSGQLFPDRSTFDATGGKSGNGVGDERRAI